MTTATLDEKATKTTRTARWACSDPARVILAGGRASAVIRDAHGVREYAVGIAPTGAIECLLCQADGTALYYTLDEEEAEANEDLVGIDKLLRRAFASAKAGAS